MSFGPMPESLLAQLEQLAQVARKPSPRLLLASDHLHLVRADRHAQPAPRPRPVLFEANLWWIDK
jgi:hypothetical protein